MVCSDIRWNCCAVFHQILEGEVVEAAFRNATAFDKEQFLKMRLSLLPGSQGNTTLRA
jgi:hypothetical protein